MNSNGHGSSQYDRQLDGMAHGLGWFSIGLGAAELLMPRALTRMLGLRGYTTLVASYGAREVAAGVGILASADPTPWLWGRVGGDALDIATLAAGLPGSRRRGRVALALVTVLGVTALDLLCAQELAGRRRQRARRPAADYRGRSGWSRPVEAMRGVARDLGVAPDMRTPKALRPLNAR